MNRGLLTAVTVLLSLLISGCGSIDARTDRGSDKTYYVGVTSDLNKIKNPAAYDYDYFDLCFLFVDVPLSFIADTVYAPFDYYHGPYKK